MVNLQWYRDRGLLHKVSRVMESDSRFNDAWRAGDVVEFEEVTESYSCGRIDVYGTGDMYGDEIGVPPMRSEDWNQFGFWLDTFETSTMWTLDELVAEYEKTNPSIRWDSKEQQP